MTRFLFLLTIYCSIYPIQLNALFNIQDTLTILCHQFPLLSTINDSNLQCARLRIDENVPSTDFNLHNPSQIILFIIIDSSSDISPVNIIINFNQSSNSSSSINEIRIGLLVIHSNFTINNQTTSIYLSYDIPILHWKNSQPNTYELIDLLHLNNREYETDRSICKWNVNRLFNKDSSFAYILKTTNPNLTFTLTDTKNTSPPSPYLNILYCIRYKLETTELVLIICFGVLLILFFVTLSILHYFKISQYFLRTTLDKCPINSHRSIPFIVD